MDSQQYHKCRKCDHKAHCNEECLECANDVCTGCSCDKCEPEWTNSYV